jgi:protein TonB
MSEQTRATAPKKIAISAGAMSGVILVKSSPIYPPIAKAQRIQGTVSIHVVVSTAGELIESTLASGNAELGSAAIEALKTWRFRPFLADGVPVEAESTLTFEFKPNEPVQLIV